MENHPIPQDVTGFQFKLIGNMTIKQFAYLVTGVVLAWVMYVLPLSGFIVFPFAFIFGLLGFALAFLPVDGRPMDAMLMYFIKALFRPNQYVFQKIEPQLSNTPVLRVTLSTSPPAQAPQPKEELPQEPKLQSQTKAEQTTPLKSQYEAAMAALSLAQAEKERLEKEILALKEALVKAQQQTTVAPIQTPPSPTSQPIVKKIAVKTAPKTPGLSVADAPNVLVGIVKDPRGNVLPNILVEVKDKDGNPVRAFKTNTFGQFASATPLLNGVYTLEFDDPQGKQKFDAIELTITGEVINPIEVTSIDQREELRKTLFG